MKLNPTIAAREHKDGTQPGRAGNPLPPRRFYPGSPRPWGANPENGRIKPPHTPNNISDKNVPTPVAPDQHMANGARILHSHRPQQRPKMPN